MANEGWAALERSILDDFQARYGAEAAVVAQAPGRVELLGNHTDYNGGLVMAAAIDRYTIVAGRPTGSKTPRHVYAQAFEDLWSPDQERTSGGLQETWQRYVQGVADLFRNGSGGENAGAFAGMPFPTGGYDALIGGNIPIGTGLSSSASLEAAFAFFLDEVDGGGPRFNSDERKMELARALQDVENREVGVACGLLDQFTVILGRANHALFLDCASQSYERLPLGEPAPAIVICDSKTSRRLADGMYNQRRAECERVVEYFQALRAKEEARERALAEPSSPFQRFWRRWMDRRDTVAELQEMRPPLVNLRGVKLSQLEEHWDRLDPIARRRARHVLTENERVERGAEALHRGDLVTLGHLMSASHRSSRDDFENSSPALDHLIEVAEMAPGFLGGKLSGAGWAGCTVNLVRTDQAEAFAVAVRTGYEHRTGVVPDVFICHAAEGASARTIGSGTGYS